MEPAIIDSIVIFSVKNRIQTVNNIIPSKNNLYIEVSNGLYDSFIINLSIDVDIANDRYAIIPNISQYIFDIYYYNYLIV